LNTKQFESSLKELNRAVELDRLPNFYSIPSNKIPKQYVYENAEDIQQYTDSSEMDPVLYQILMFTSGSLPVMWKICNEIHMIESCTSIHNKLLEFIDPSTAEAKNETFTLCMEALIKRQKTPVRELLPESISINTVGVKNESLKGIIDLNLKRESGNALFDFFRSALYRQQGLWVLGLDIPYTFKKEHEHDDYKCEININFTDSKMIITSSD
jgi:hypothetical protein